MAVRREKLEAGLCAGANLSIETQQADQPKPAAATAMRARRVDRRIHHSHLLMSIGPFLWCRKCGYYSSGGRVDKLRYVCPGVPENQSCKALIVRLSKGLPLAGMRANFVPSRAG